MIAIVILVSVGVVVVIVVRVVLVRHKIGQDESAYTLDGNI